MAAADRSGHSAGYRLVYRAGGAAALQRGISGYDFLKNDAPAAGVGSGRKQICFLGRHRRPGAVETALLLAGLEMMEQYRKQVVINKSREEK